MGWLCSNLFGQFTCWKQKTSFVKILCQFSGFVCFMCFMCILCMFYLNFSLIFIFLVFCAFCWGFRFEHENSTCSAQSFNMARWFFRFLVKGFVGLARFRYFKITMHNRLWICKKVNLKMYFANSVLPWPFLTSLWGHCLRAELSSCWKQSSQCTSANLRCLLNQQRCPKEWAVGAIAISGNGGNMWKSCQEVRILVHLPEGQKFSKSRWV